VPSPWGEAAKGILHVKNIEWTVVRLVYDSEPLKEWAGQRSGPILMYNNERPRAGWAEILLLSERKYATKPAPVRLYLWVARKDSKRGVCRDIWARARESRTCC
jgi:hypothetical protein